MINKIVSHYGINDYYKYFISKYPNSNMDKKEFKKIYSLFNKEMVNEIIEKGSFKLPKRFGQIEIIKKKREVYINKEGCVINNKPIDWKATKDLWNNNKEAKEKKVLIRHNNKHTGGFVFRIFYNKNVGKYKNKTVYFFKPVRDFSRSITKRINDYSMSKYDAYIKQ